MAKAAVIGASGYTGAELLRLCAGHPDLDVAVATADSSAGSAIAAVYPSLAPAYGGRTFETYDADAVDGVDVAFLCLPHGESQALVPDLRTRVGHIVDLGADFRLRDPAVYETWYHHAHTQPGLLADFAYGLPELFREPLAGAALIAAPGCYPTAAALALAPFVRAGAVATAGIIVDAASGVSGAGKALKATSLYGSVNEDFTAYGLLDHRHTPEIEQSLGAEVLFTPHLAPMTRGILATCYARPTDATLTTDVALGLLQEAYAGEPFVIVSDRPPSTKATLGSNSAHLTARVDPRTGWLVAIAAIDNLVKGASGQMVQCANLALGLPETTGLPTIGLTP